MSKKRELLLGCVCVWVSIKYWNLFIDIIKEEEKSCYFSTNWNAHRPESNVSLEYTSEIVRPMEINDKLQRKYE